MRLKVCDIVLAACLVASYSCYVDGWLEKRCIRGVVGSGRWRGELALLLSMRWEDEGSQLQDWMVGRGSRKEDMRIRIVAAGIYPHGPIAVAKMDIREKDVLFNFPLGECITVEKATAQWNGAITAKDLRTGSLGLLALYLLTELDLKTDSKYYAYLQTLPRETPGILSWESSLAEELVQSTTRKISSQLEACDRDIEFIQQMLARLSVDNSRKVTPPINPEGFTGERFRWALGVVKSRYAVLDQKPTIVPGR